MERPAPVEAAEPAAGEAQERTPPKGRVFVSLGQKEGADEAKLRELVKALAPGLQVNAIAVRESHSFLEVEPEAVEGAVAALNGKDYEGKTLTAEKARRRRR